MPLTIVNDRWTEGTHIIFRDIGSSESGKTRRFEVAATDVDMYLLGRIEWFGRWRKYCFFPGAGTLYEETCLNEIAEFIKSKTTEHRQKLKDAKKVLA